MKSPSSSHHATAMDTIASIENQVFNQQQKRTSLCLLDCMHELKSNLSVTTVSKARAGEIRNNVARTFAAMDVLHVEYGAKSSISNEDKIRTFSWLYWY